MRVLPWAVTVGVCFVVTGLLTGIKYLQYANAMAMVESFPPPYSVVSAENVATTEWTPVRRLTGTVRAPQFVQIAAEATGRVIELPAAAGHIVNTGDIVLKLFDEDLKAQRDALVADLNLVKVQLERVQKLKQQSLASQDQLDTLLARGESLTRANRINRCATESAHSSGSLHWQTRHLYPIGRRPHSDG